MPAYRNAVFIREVVVMTRRRIGVLILVFFAFALLSLPLGAAEKKIEITLWHHWTGGQRIGYVQQVLDEFNQLYPWIEATQISQGTAGASTKLTNFIVGGASPELVQVSSLYAVPFIAQGAFLKLDELAVRDRVNLRMFNAVDLGSFQLHGGTLPVTSGVAWTNLMIYNKSMMAEVGLNPEAPARTWDEWRQHARRMTRTAGDGSLLRAGTSIPPIMNAVTTSPGSTPTLSPRKTTGLWFQNNSAFGFLKDVDFEWGAKLAPVGPQPGSKPVGLVQSTWAYAIPVTVPQEKREAAWLLLSWITTKQESAGWFTRVQGRPSAITAFDRHPDYLRGRIHRGVPSSKRSTMTQRFPRASISGTS